MAYRAKINILLITAALLLGILSTPAQATQTGSIVGWGIEVFGVDTSSGFTTIAAGYGHSLGLKDDGTACA